MPFNRTRPSMEDDLPWKMTIDVTQPFMEKDHQWKKTLDRFKLKKLSRGAIFNGPDGPYYIQNSSHGTWIIFLFKQGGGR